MKTLKPVSYINVDVTGGFWKSRQEINAKVTLKAVRDRFYETGRFEANLLRYIEGQPNKPYLWFVGDVEKWIEACAYVLKKYPDPEMQSVVHFMLCELEDEGAVKCNCGGGARGHYEFKFVGNKLDNVLIWCTECSASVTVPLTDTAQVNDFLHIDKLRLT